MIPIPFLSTLPLGSGPSSNVYAHHAFVSTFRDVNAPLFMLRLWCVCITQLGTDLGSFLPNSVIETIYLVRRIRKRVWIFRANKCKAVASKRGSHAYVRMYTQIITIMGRACRRYKQQVIVFSSSSYLSAF